MTGPTPEHNEVAAAYKKTLHSTSLCDIIIKLVLHDTFLITEHCSSCYSDDRKSWLSILLLDLTNLLSSSNTVHNRHLYIEECCVVSLLLIKLNGLFSIFSYIVREACHTKELSDNLLVNWLILCNKDTGILAICVVD